ncbi:sugar ABC transporter substrate-binding protein [Listeria rocourtiae]|uniref:ABC transporter substrate-binding protein n=1 Tax=Listeria rocourtiae TaxID=647910 RepID=UPI00162353D1|nr:sugar ABC transporter substrate-binding protein [Listeria rocourtiae]MBC1436372.1 sugar ABC transporter substrate-binding protein [Listeria rocourtiae]MBC1604411.1 sugar ABC transporter substrate-binding protein [Listeria rocourtiae]
MKKRFAILLIVSMLAMLALAACGGSSADSDSKNKKELTAWAWNVNVKALEEAAKQYEKDNKGFKLKVVEMSNTDAYQKITTGLQAGGKGLPDILLIEDDQVQGYLENFPKAFVNLSDKGFDDEKSKFPEYKISLLSKKDKIYGFPFDAGPTGVFYRTDIFKEAGVDPNTIQTWDDYIAAGKTIKQKTGKDMIGMDYNNDDGQYRIMLNTLGTFYFDDKGDIAFTSDESVKAMGMIQKIKDAGISKNTSGWDPWVSALANGEVVTAPTGAWFSGSLIQQAPDLAGKWSVFPIPAVEKGGSHAANNGGSNFMIPTVSEKSDEAYKFLKYFSTSNDVQELAMSEGGLFPSLNTVYETETFKNAGDYFTQDNIWQLFAAEMDEIKPANYTGNFSIAKDEAVKAQSKALEGGDVKDALEVAKKSLANRIQQ